MNVLLADYFETAGSDTVGYLRRVQVLHLEKRHQGGFSRRVGLGDLFNIHVLHLTEEYCMYTVQSKKC
jgi:hypothetical protein